MNIQLLTAELDGLKIAYSTETLFIVQVGKGSRGAYKTRCSFAGTHGLQRAVMHYRGINIGNGYKKRLIAPSMNKPLLARSVSHA